MWSRNVRAFCFKSTANPTWKAPKFIADRAEELLTASEEPGKSHKLGSTLCPLARVLNLDNFLALIMDDHQVWLLQYYYFCFQFL